MADTDTDQKLKQALFLAKRGWHVFPAEAKDKPHIKAWQTKATTDLDQIRQWWAKWPDAIVCVVPGLSGKTAIDIDIHPGRPSGFDSAIMAGAPIKAEVQGTSLSGHGHHLWYDGLNKTTQDVNELESVDSRSVGGYIAMSRYALPYVDEVTEPIPEAYRVPLEAPKRQSGQARVQQWLKTHDGDMSEHLAEYVSETPQPFRGRADMHTRVLHVVRCGAEGEEGATAALLELRRRWMASPHNEADPGQEFDNSVTSNIRDYGFEKPVEFTSLMRKAGLSSAKGKPAMKREPVKDALYADIGAVLDGKVERIEPTAGGVRTDGLRLLYAGKVNGLIGDPEQGKSLVAAGMALDTLQEGGSVLCVDLDHNGAVAVVQRLMSLGADAQQLRDPELFRFAEPDDSREMDAIVADAAAREAALVIVDSLGELLPLYDRAE